MGALDGGAGLNLLRPDRDHPTVCKHGQQTAGDESISRSRTLAGAWDICRMRAGPPPQGNLALAYWHHLAHIGIWHIGGWICETRPDR